jgi:hypothetical protein
MPDTDEEHESHVEVSNILAIRGLVMRLEENSSKTLLLLL